MAMVTAEEQTLSNDLVAETTRTIILINVDGSRQIIKQTVRFQRTKVPTENGKVTYSGWAVQPDSPKEWAEYEVPEIEECAPDRTYLPNEEVNAWTPDSTIMIVYHKFDNERLDDRYVKISSRPVTPVSEPESAEGKVFHGLGLRIAGLKSLFGLRRAN